VADFSDVPDDDAPREELLRRISVLRYEALHDPLTGVANRYLFTDRLDLTLALARRTRQKAAVLVLDLDGFKDVNDEHGHETGDGLLRVTAERISATMRESDTVARLGGDEFGVVMLGTDRDGAEQAATRLRVQLGRSVTLRGIEVATGVSVGAAIFPDDAADPMDLLRVADDAMYADKREHDGPGAIRVLRRLGQRRAR
jgi:diguanylate cyclase